MKTAIKTLLISMTMVGLGTGCDASDIARFFDQLGTGVGNPGDATNDLPGDEPTNDLPCITLLGHDCGDDPGANEPPAPPPGDCACPGFPGDPGAPNPPPGWEDPHRPCFEAFDDCLIGNALPVEACEDGLTQCLDAIPHPCHGLFDACFAATGDALHCQIEADACQIGVAPPYPGPPPHGLCDQMFELCLLGGVDPVLCDEARAQCSDPAPPCDGEPTEPPYPGDPGVNGSN